MLDSVFIAVSSVLIPEDCGSQKESLKALRTCVSHVCAVLIFYVLTTAFASMHHFGKHKAPMATIIIADIFASAASDTVQIHGKFVKRF